MLKKRKDKDKKKTTKKVTKKKVDKDLKQLKSQLEAEIVSEIEEKLENFENRILQEIKQRKAKAGLLDESEEVEELEEAEEETETKQIKNNKQNKNNEDNLEEDEDLKEDLENDNEQINQDEEIEDVDNKQENKSNETDVDDDFEFIDEDDKEIDGEINNLIQEGDPVDNSDDDDEDEEDISIVRSETNDSELEVDNEEDSDEDEIIEDSEDKQKEKKIKKNKKVLKNIIGEKNQTERDELVSLLSKRKRNKDVTKKLEKIYENNDGSLPNMKEFKKKKSNRFLTMFIGFLIFTLLLGALAWLGFFVLKPRSEFSEKNVSLTVSGEEKVSIGEEVTYRVRYHNAQNVDLENAVLQIKYPKGFVYLDSSQKPINSTNDKWELGTIPAQANNYIDIKGKIYGSIDEKQSFRVFLEYNSSNFSSNFQNVTNFTVITEKSPLGLELRTPEKVNQGSETFLEIILRPQAETMKNIKVVLDPGPDFIKQNSEPETVDNESYEWLFPEIDQETKIKIKGSFIAEDAKNSEIVSVDVYYLPTDVDKTNTNYLLGHSEAEVMFNQNEVGLSLLVNGTNDNFEVMPGEMLSTSLNLKNLSDKDIEDVIVKLIFDTASYNRLSILNWSKMSTEEDIDLHGEQLDENTREGVVTWSKKYTPKLAKISSGEDITFDFQIPLKTAEIIDLTGFKTNKITVRAEVDYEEDGVSKNLASKQIELVVNSDLDVKVEDEVKDVGQTQEHKIKWIVTNSFHELSNLKLEADFYGDISIDTDNIQVPAGKINFDKNTKTLSWEIEKMPIEVDILALEFVAKLNELNPTQKNLCSRLKIKAHDIVTDQDIVLVRDGILLDLSSSNSETEEE